MIEKIKSESMDLLFEAILTLESVDECYKFFDDLCTSIELKSFAQRLEVAKLLDEHKSGKNGNMQKIWSFYSFILWYEQFFVLN